MATAARHPEGAATAADLEFPDRPLPWRGSDSDLIAPPKGGRESFHGRDGRAAWDRLFVSRGG
jgi:hypothetical protein